VRPAVRPLLLAAEQHHEHRLLHNLVPINVGRDGFGEDAEQLVGAEAVDDGADALDVGAGEERGVEAVAEHDVVGDDQGAAKWEGGRERDSERERETERDR
jgi:hypothetical protein